jgi:hypothetical protein
VKIWDQQPTEEQADDVLNLQFCATAVSSRRRSKREQSPPIIKELDTNLIKNL